MRVRLALTLLATILSITLAGCGFLKPSAAVQPTQPARVHTAVKESDLANVTLTPQANERLGISVAVVERRAVDRARTFGGEVIVPPGQTAAVSAPVTGTVLAPEHGQIPAVGDRVAKGQLLYRLEPLLSPPDRVRLAETLVTLAGARVEAEGQAEKAAVQLESAKAALARAERLLKDKAGSAKTVEEAQAQVAIEEAALKAARARYRLLAKMLNEAEAGSLDSLPIAAPHHGLLQNAHVFPGQLVPAGSPLFEIVQADSLWVRVPIYVGDLTQIYQDRPAQVRELTDVVESSREALPVTAPPSANITTVTADLYYQYDNSDGRLRPGQRVIVTLPLKTAAQSLVVPRSSIVYDIHGGAWVYEQLQPHSFVRRRIQILYVADSVAVLETGPAAGSEVVTNGVAELFGTELGFAK